VGGTTVTSRDLCSNAVSQRSRTFQFHFLRMRRRYRHDTASSLNCNRPFKPIRSGVAARGKSGYGSKLPFSFSMSGHFVLVEFFSKDTKFEANIVPTLGNLGTKKNKF